MKSKFKKRTIALLSMFVLIFICAAGALAATLFKSFVESSGSAGIGTTEKVVDVSDSSKKSVMVNSSIETLSFTASGDSSDVDITVSNRSKSVVEYQYELAFDSETFDLRTESIASAILVYFNGEFVDTLGNLCANEENRVEKGYLDFKGYVNKATTAAVTTTDKLTFELHSAADKSYVDGATAYKFELRTYAKTADYTNSIYVSTADEFKAAVNDINSGLIEEAKIFVMNNITLSAAATFNYPVTIDLCGNSLAVNGAMTFAGEGLSTIKSSKPLAATPTMSGSIVVNNASGALNIEDFKTTSGANAGYAYSNIASATAYDEEVVDALVLERVKSNVRYGVASDASIYPYGGLTFYGFETSVSNGLTYSNGVLTANATTVTKSESIGFKDHVVGVKVLGDGNDAILASLLEGELKHLVKLSEKDEEGVLKNTNSSDLFLPTSVKSKNVTIEWVSANENLLSNTGILSSNISGSEVISLYAHITINGVTYTEKFETIIMSQNHETIFQYFIATLSPITLETMFTGANQAQSYYYLPIVDADYNPANNDSYVGFDYRSQYRTPDLAIEPNGYEWVGFDNVGFEYIQYEALPAYSYVSVNSSATSTNGKDGVAVYLNSATFQSFAQVKVTGKFVGDDEVYTGDLNLLIDLGYNTELNELVFNMVAQKLNETNVLQNILDTRKVNGMKNEKGDFWLDGSYQTYYISYVIPESSRGAISSIIGYSVSKNEDGEEVLTEIGSIGYGESFDEEEVAQIGRYKICVNPAYFGNTDTAFGINTILTMPSVTHDTASRILYFTCPGVIRNDEVGFNNQSVFNSVKYQVFKKLQTVTNESVNGDVLEDDYTLSSDAASFVVSGSKVTNYTGAYILRHDASFVDTLAFDLSENYTSTDNHAIYGLSKIIDWATGDTTDTFKNHFNGNDSIPSAFITANATKVADGNVNISGNEESIIKSYYLTYINSDEDAFDELWNTVSKSDSDASGEEKYTLTNGSGFASEISAFFNDTSTYGTNSEGVNSFAKFQEVLQWATNTTDFRAESGWAAGTAPNILRVCYTTWSDLVGTEVSTWTRTVYSLDNRAQASKYNSTAYAEDETELISKAELEIIMAFLLNIKSASAGTTTQGTKAKNFVHDIIPNYFSKTRKFTVDGIGKLIHQAYVDAGKNFNSDNGFSAEISGFAFAGSTYVVPHVTLMDNSIVGFDYFENLTTLLINGDYNGKLYAFHTTENLAAFFNRTTSNNQGIQNLMLEGCSNSNVDFSIKNIYKLYNLKKLSLQHNQGITNVGAILKLDLTKLTYVDLADIGLTNEYTEFAMRAINYLGNNASVYYTPDGTTRRELYTGSMSSAAEGLTYIDEFYELLAESATLVDTVYSSDGTEINVDWVIDEGNNITLVKYYNDPAIYVNGYANTFETLDHMPAKYYYCTNGFTYDGHSFRAGKIYKIYGDGNFVIGFQELDGVNVVEGNVPTSAADVPADVFQEIKDSAVAVAASKGAEIYESDNTASATWSSWSSEKKISGTRLQIYDSTGKLLAETSQWGNATIYQSTRTATVTYKYYYLNYPAGLKAEVEKYYYVEGEVYKVSMAYQEYNSDITKTIVTYTITKTEYKYRGNIWGGNTEASNSKNSSWSYVMISGTRYERYAEGAKTKVGESAGGTTTVDQFSFSQSLYISRCETINAANYNKTLDTLYASINTAVILSSSFPTSESLYEEGNLVTTTAAINSAGRKYYYTSINSSSAYSVSYIVTNTYGTDQNYYPIVEMYAIQNEANKHTRDGKIGIYYHNYYAYAGYTLTFGPITMTNKYIYRLELNEYGRFYFTQSSNANERYYTEVTGANKDLVNQVAGLTTADIGKVFFYSGSVDSATHQSKDVFFQVVYDGDLGFAFKRFGVLGQYYMIAENGDFMGYNSISNGTISFNSSGLTTIANLMIFMDVTYKQRNEVSTDYSYGIGGTRDAVFMAIVTDSDGTVYTRKFIVSVTGTIPPVAK